MKKLTRTEARKAINWFRHVVGIQDWEFRYFIQSRPPSWLPDQNTRACGWSQSYRREKLALIWVSPERCAAEPIDPLQILFHELAHVMLADVTPDGEGHDATQREEFMLGQLDAVLAFAYRRGMKP